jgi:hypothetical protein
MVRASEAWSGMSLAILVPVVAIGIALVVAAVHFTGGSREAALAGEEEAGRRFAQDFPDERIEHVWLTQDGRSAFLQLRDGRVGIVQGVGGRFLTRIVAAGELTIAQRAAATVSLRFRDFTWSGGEFMFPSDREAEAVLDALGESGAHGRGRA